MNTQPDFEELLKLLEKNNVNYMIVGGYALAFHGYPRFTKDIDIFFHNSKGNIKKLRNSLLSFDFTEKEIPESLFTERGNILQFGVIPVRIDLINEIDGVAFKEAEKNISRGHYGDVEVNFIGKIDLIKNKKASGRPQDKVDAETLEKDIS
jgi:hypothetical protein